MARPAKTPNNVSPTMKEFHRILRTSGMTQKQLAERVKLGRTRLNTWLTKPASQLPTPVIMEICRVANCPPELEAQLIAESTGGEPVAGLAAQLCAQHGTVWVIGSRFQLPIEDETANVVKENIGKGTRYVFWSDDEYSLNQVVTTLKDKAVENLDASVMCILGPPFLGICPWSIEDPMGVSSVYHLRTRQLVPWDREAGDSIMAFKIRALLGKPSEALKDPQQDEFELTGDGYSFKFRRVYPPSSREQR